MFPVSVQGDLAPDAGKMPAAFVIADEAAQVESDAVHAGQLGLSIPVIVSIFHGCFFS